MTIGLTKDSVEETMREYVDDPSGFMANHDFSENFDYVVNRPDEETYYPAKAIFCVAYSSIEGNADITARGLRNSFSDAKGGPIHSEFARLGYEITNRRQRLEKEIQADLIREHVIANYIDPARKRGEDAITVRAGDVHQELGLSNQLPNVCQAIRGKKLRDLTGLAEPEIIAGPASGNGSNMTYRFVLDRSSSRAMTDEELLTRFDGNAEFRAKRVSWTDTERAAFCGLARSVNAAGLDWYHTDIPQIRFGRKSFRGSRAEGTLGSLQLRREHSFLEFSHQADSVGLKGQYRFNTIDLDRFADALNRAHSSLESWRPNTPDRPGKWPDDYRDISQNHDKGAELMKPTNLILYGPPGTGKTYHTAREAVALCDGQANYPESAEGRAALMARYNELVVDKRIGFVTFHQNYGYEDFVEGLRPVPITNNDGEAIGFHLEPEPGVFRQISERAETEGLAAGGEAFNLAERAIYKMSLGELADPASDFVFTESIADGYALFGFRDIDWSDPRFEERDEIFSALKERFPKEDITPNKGLVQSPDVFRNQLQIGDVLIVAKGNNQFRAIGIVEGDYEYAPRSDGRYCHRRKVRWLWNDSAGLDVGELYPPKFIQKTLYRLKDSELNRPLIARLVSDAADNKAQGKSLPYVLIIDEINRANVSKVFGELITLLETDKRGGMLNGLSVTLPYSKRVFSVPANLHIIGTMNTADRSIALLDTALRRRFTFRELEPDTTVPAFQLAVAACGLPLDKVLNTINERIEYLLDREHRIGHAFFIGCASRAAAENIMREKVIPLLQEYFFEDWSRVAAVLGDGFIDGKSLPAPPNLEEDLRSSREPKRWSVLSPFKPDAFNRLVGSMPTDPLAPDGAS